MQACDFPNGMTVAELKEMVRDWPETDEFGEPCEVWLCDDQGFSNQVRMVTPLNWRQSEDKTKAWADLMLGDKSTDEAYRKGRADMRDEIISKLGDYKAVKCAQIAASIPITLED